MPYGYNGKFLEIDLGFQSYKEILIDPKIIKSHLLGSGYGIYYMLKYFNIHVNPLSPEAPLLIFTGLLTGTPFPAACKMSVCGLSPLTGIWNESTVGGYFPAALKSTGYDGLLIKGRSANPIYLVIKNQDVEFKDAGHLWGKDTFFTNDKIIADEGEKLKVMCIGPAGERSASIASIICEGRNARSAGRGGMGAVMGSKKLKAIAACGDIKSELFSQDLLLNEVKEKIPVIKENTMSLHEFGTSGGIINAEARGDLPVKNWRDGSFKEKVEKVSGQEIKKLTFEKDYSCFACPVGCGKIMNFIHPKYGNLHSHSPELEAVEGFSALIMNDDPYLVCAASEYCDRMGLDAISASSAVAFAMECYEYGILSGIDLQGIKLEWGNADAVMAVLEQMAKGAGIGAILTGGVKKAAETIGKNSSEFAVHVKGLEVAMHDPRAFYSMAADYMTANRGACHLEGLSYTLGIGRYYDGIGLPDTVSNDSQSAALLSVLTQNFFGIFNPLGICKFMARGGVNIFDIAKWLKYITDINMSNDELLHVSERVFNEKRLLNVKLGISRKDDILPARLYCKKRGSGIASDNLADVGSIISDYYKLRGWNEFGVPSNKKLDELAIEFRV